MNNDLLKFRVWDEALQHYRDRFYIGGDGKLFYLSNSGELIAAQSVDFVVEHCTGMKDVNKRLVYENDIIQCCRTGRLCTVRWFQTDGWFFEGITPDECVIVGNIHEGVKK